MKKKNLLLFCIPIAIIVLFYLGGMLIYSDSFLPNTYINKTNVGGQKVIEVENNLKAIANKGKITLIKNDDSTEEINLKDIDYTCEYATNIKDIKDSQSPFKWLFAFFGEEDYDIEVKTSYNKEKLDSIINNLKCVTNEAIQDPVNAHVEKTETGFIVVDAIDGNRLEIEKLKETIKSNLEAGNYEIDLKKAECYKTAEIKADDPTIKQTMDLVNKFNDLVITLDLTGATETIDFAKFKDWIITKDGVVTVDDEAVKQYATNLSVEYNTYGQTRKFKATGIGEISVGGTQYDSYGFQLDINKTRDIIKEAILACESKTIKPEWKIPAMTRGYNDIGDTYIEVDLTRQHLWFYKVGKLFLETDIKSGLPTKERETPTGAFRIWSKEKDRYLTGPGYRSHVDFWMPFSWTGCGIHDATWTNAFGGQYYKTSGSHGCLNTPYDNAKKIYDNVDVDTPCIVYKS